jgi:hypothetical protein
MTVSFHKWFGISCLHEYFSDGRCRVLTLAPTAECAGLLARYRCLFRPTPGGGAVYVGESEGASLLQDFHEHRPLAFTLTSTDPGLDTYTDIDPFAAHPAPSESLYYFSNLDGHSDADSEREHQLLHPPGAALVNGPLVVKPHAFRFELDAPMRGVTLELKDASNRQTVWESKTSDEEASVCNLDLAGVSNGRYNLNVNGKQALAFYLSDQPPVKTWGLIELFPGGPAMADRIPEACRLIDASAQLHPRSFAVSLETRKTTWRYHITDKSPNGQGYDDFTVVGTRKSRSGKPSRKSESLLFSKVQPSPGSGEPTLLFESQQALPLLQAPSGEHVFSFKPGDASANAGLKLPYATPRGTRVDTVSGKRRMYSDIYVYL